MAWGYFRNGQNSPVLTAEIGNKQVKNCGETSSLLSAVVCLIHNILRACGLIFGFNGLVFKSKL